MQWQKLSGTGWDYYNSVAEKRLSCQAVIYKRVSGVW